MSAFRSVTQGFRNLWGQGGDDEYEDVAEELEETPRSSRSTKNHEPDDSEAFSGYDSPRRAEQYHAGSVSSSTDSERFPRYTAPPSASSVSEAPVPSFLSGSTSSPSPSGARKLRPVAMPLRSREKNIYTLKPKSMDEASLAADYLKTGCAVVLNLEEVERMVAIRIIDFMSGVCYGLEHQGHAMKLGDVIFLFTPGEFEISSDETDYAENRDILFKDVHHDKKPTPAISESKPQAQPQPIAVAAVAERRSWER